MLPHSMTPEEPSAESPMPPSPGGPGGHRRRGRRGGRGRGRGPRRATAPGPSEATPGETNIPAPEAPRSASSHPEGSAISQAVNEVMDIVESLKQASERMEEVLELVEH